VYDNCKLIVTCTVSRENPCFQMQFSNFNNFLMNGSYQAYDVELGSDNPLVRFQYSDYGGGRRATNIFRRWFLNVRSL